MNETKGDTMNEDTAPHELAHYLSPVAHDGRSKVDRYNWVKDLGPEGVSQKVSKHKLFIDTSYQRNLQEGPVAKITRDFNWAAFGTLLVFQRPDGTLQIVDGQHRHAAALRRADVDLVPCQIFPTKGDAEEAAAEEAAAFLNVHIARKAVSAVAKHKARLKTGDAVAIKVQTLIDEAGLVFGNNTRPGTIKCAHKLTSLMRAYEHDLLRVWPVIIAASEASPIHEDVIDGLMYLERNASERISTPRWADRITKIGANTLHLAAIREARAFSKGGAKVWAAGIYHEINKKLMAKSKLKWSESMLLED